MIAKGRFDVTLIPLEAFAKSSKQLTPGRMSIEKKFDGDLIGSSQGEMLSIRTDTPTSAGYVAIEIIEGVLDSKKGSFALQHFATMHQDSQFQLLRVVPNSGAGDLRGLNGEMKIIIEKDQHFYEFDYSFTQHI